MIFGTVHYLLPTTYCIVFSACCLPPVACCHSLSHSVPSSPPLKVTKSQSHKVSKSQSLTISSLTTHHSSLTSLLLSYPHQVKHECILHGGFPQSSEPAGYATMTAFHIDMKKQQVIIGFHIPQFGYPLGRFPILHL